MREFFAHVLANPLMMSAFPDYLNGFLLALNFTARIGRFVVELLSNVFGKIPNATLMPYLPELMLRFRSSPALVQTLLKEASAAFPKALREFETWHPPWEETAAKPAQAQVVAEQLSESEQAARRLLFAHPAAADALAGLFGVSEFHWIEELAAPAAASADAPTASEQAACALLRGFPETAQAMADMLKK